MKKAGIIGLLLLLATCPENWVAWGLLALVCAAAIVFPCRRSISKHIPGRTERAPKGGYHERENFTDHSRAC